LTPEFRGSQLTILLDIETHLTNSLQVYVKKFIRIESCSWRYPGGRTDGRRPNGRRTELSFQYVATAT
jgi:hypothetical protein